MSALPLLQHVVDLRFLRILAASPLPRRVPVGPAFELVLAYQAAGFVELAIPALIRTRAGHAIQPAAVVLAVTPMGHSVVARNGSLSPTSRSEPWVAASIAGSA
ncbi:hypothetical protein [Pseudorhodoferax sp. Leaf267]|uniref:hypothetical protein n=1 Tax=Pseudorhodoferax sp. Leaf267 TaxID=1736316 RepID=UPI0012E1977B|nr:hypothetical protein [Pseudorhodoferax sp. Leaf267]